MFSKSSLNCACLCGDGLFLSSCTYEGGCSCIYHVYISSKRTHGLRKRFPYKKLTQPYARAGFAYAQLRYDNTLSKHEHEGLANGSSGSGHKSPAFCFPVCLTLPEIIMEMESRKVVIHGHGAMPSTSMMTSGSAMIP